MTIKFYMDEQVPRQITVGLRMRNVDILSIQEDDRAGFLDPDVLKRANELGRILFTRDDDFLTIANLYFETGESFGGIVYAHQQMASIGDCVRDLELIARSCTREEFINHIEYLPL